MTGDDRDVQVHRAQVSMPKARHPETEELFAAEDIAAHRHTWPEPLRCQHCPALVHTVLPEPSEHRRARAPHFARNRSKDEGPPNRHRRGCPYDIDTLIAVLIEESEQTLTPAGRAVDADGHRAALYRLPIPGAFGPRALPGESTAEDGTFTAQPLPLLNTAAKITAMLEYFEHLEAQIDVVFRAVCRGTDVAWPNFFYSPRRTWVLEQRAATLGDPNHPVAVVFHPLNRDPAGRRQEPGRSYGWVRSVAGTPVGHETEEVVLFVDGPAQLVDQVFVQSNALIDDLFIGYGMWRLISRSGKEPRLTLTLDRTSAVAPLPPNLHRQVLAGWRQPLR